MPLSRNDSMADDLISTFAFVGHHTAPQSVRAFPMQPRNMMGR